MFSMFNSTGALCKGANISIFFPDFADDDGNQVFDDGTVFESYGDTTPFYNEARSICSECPIKERCLDYAMEHRIRFGMFGGLTPIERRRIERRDRRKRLQERRRMEAAATLDDFADTVDDDDFDSE